MSSNEPTYLGDGVTVTNDGWHLAVTADRTKTIFMDPSVFAGLIRFAPASGWTDPEYVQGIVDDAVARPRESGR